MTGNRAVAYVEPGVVEVQTIDYPDLELHDGPGVDPHNVGRQCRHGVIVKVLASSICGSDQHMVRGRTTAPPDLVLGHEVTGEVIEKGPDVDAAATARSARPASASASIRPAPVPPTDTWTWAAGSAAKPST